MRPHTILWGLAAATLSLVASANDFTARDSVEFATFEKDVGKSEVTWSPDGRRFVVVVRKPILAKDANEYCLWAFDAKDIAEGGRSRACLQSTNNQPAISQLQWIGDTTVRFLGVSRAGTKQSYRADIIRGELIQETFESADVLDYQAASGTEIVSLIQPRPKETGKPGFVVDRPYLAQIVNPELGSILDDTRPFVATIVRRAGAPPMPVREIPPLGIASYARNWISPDGRHAISFRMAGTFKPEWAEFVSGLRGYDPAHYARRSGILPFTFVLIDLRDGTVRPALDAPIGSSFANDYIRPVAFWSADSRRVILVNTFLPLATTNGEERERRRRSAAIVEVDIESGAMQVLRMLPEGLEGAEKGPRGQAAVWEPDKNRLVVTQRSRTASPPTLIFTKSTDGWKTVEVAAGSEGKTEGGAIAVRVEEDENTPPRLVATPPGRSRKVSLLDPNPQLAKLALGKAQPLTWRSEDGVEWSGGLTVPPGYVAGKRLPLVIQTHGFNRGRFMHDGPFSSAFAAQALAARGIAVLQLPDYWPAIIVRDEARIHMRGMESAIDFLHAQGIVDRDRVGLIGFSRTCYYVKYALSQSTYPFRAATTADGYDEGYFQYILSVGLLAGARTHFEINNGGQFWSHREEWLERVPNFNAHRIRAPLRVEAYSRASALSNWETYAALSILERPVEMLVFPNGAHELVKPKQRLLSLEGNVDWFDFWLNGHEDPDPAKADQYRRWEKLKELAEKSRAL